MKLEELVPKIELCKLIPDGEFADSALVWRIVRGKYSGERVLDDVFPRECGRCGTMDSGSILAPAPTLLEIMVEIDNLGGWCPTAYRLQNSWTVDYQEDNEDGMKDVVEQSDLDNPATAALKLWLELKGENK